MAVRRPVAVPVAHDVLYGKHAHPLLHVGDLLEPFDVVTVTGVVDTLDQSEKALHLVGRALVGPRCPAEAVVPRLNSVSVLFAAQNGRV